MHQIRLAIVLAIIAAVGAAGCRRHSAEWQRLDLADALMEEAPDSAFAVICAIDTAQLVGDSERARYALLKSMAMDKNYIDTTDFSVLQPAIDYYLKKGTPDERLRTLYYKGCILQNAGKIDKAIETFVDALELKDKATDSLTLARTYVAQGAIFLRMYRIEQFTQNNLAAATLYDRLSKEKLSLKGLIRAFDGSILLKDKKLADSIVSVINSKAQLSDDIREIWLHRELTYHIAFGEKDSIENFLKVYTFSAERSEPVILDLAYGYNTLNQPDSALYYLNLLNENVLPENKLKYYILYSNAYKLNGDYKNAYRYIMAYFRAFDDIHITMFAQDMQFAEQRHKLEIGALKESESRKALFFWTCIVCLISMLLVTLIYFRLRITKLKQKETEQKRIHAITLLEKERAENENLQNKIDSLERERDDLEELLQSETPPDPIVEKIIRERMQHLNALLAGYITTDSRSEEEYLKWVKGLIKDKDTFMNDTRMALTATHPRLIHHLESCGLSTDEINYLSLYAIGLRGKEVGNYIHMSSYYNISCAIRKKLNLDGNKTNLGVYIRKLMEKM